MKCGCCGEGFSKISKNRYGCTAARKKGTCDNRTTIAQDKLEGAILSGLQTQLMRPDLLAIYCDAYTKEMAVLQKSQYQYVDQAKAKLTKLATEKTSLINAIKQGIPADELKDEFARNTMQREQAELMLKGKADKPLLLKPDMAESYRQEVANLRETLNDDDACYEVIELIRTLIDKIILVPDEHHQKRLKIDLYGDLAGMLSIASGQKITRDHMLIDAFEKNHQAIILHPPNGKQELNDLGEICSWLKC
jgi:hypothetical protein